MLLDGYPTLLGIALTFGLTHPELDVEVGDVFAQDIPLQAFLDDFVPYRFGVQMKVLFEAPRDDYSAGELLAKLGWNCQPALVVEFALEIIYLGHVFGAIGPTG